MYSHQSTRRTTEVSWHGRALFRRRRCVRSQRLAPVRSQTMVYGMMRSVVPYGWAGPVPSMGARVGSGSQRLRHDAAKAFFYPLGTQAGPLQGLHWQRGGGSGVASLGTQAHADAIPTTTTVSRTATIVIGLSPPLPARHSVGGRHGRNAKAALQWNERNKAELVYLTAPGRDVSENVWRLPP